jgi:glucosyl-3-phosphoglycerate synthase
MKLNKWLQERTFHHSDFWDRKKLVKLKEKRNLKISLCFPTLNEEKTIGKEIIIMKSELQDRYPLIDEIAVVDSGSTDKTCEIAKEFGAKVFLAEDYLKQEGPAKGKGENLWKSIYLLDGDIIIFIDADISNIHPKFAYGLIGPLLQNEDIKFVKAFYERPITLPGNVTYSGGGRVTEILIRPLFCQFFPELSGIIQPLSGEFAAYREVFEKIPFPIGYGIETGMLIDICAQWGRNAIAQTNLDKRIHRNQPVASLGKMAFGILQTFWNRLEAHNKIKDMEEFSCILRQVKIDEQKYSFNENKIIETERKPMIEVEEYLKKWNIKK